MNAQDLLKMQVAQMALKYLMPNSVVGVGTGSTVNFFIDGLLNMKGMYKGAVSSSEKSTERLLAGGMQVFDLNEVDEVPVYVDGADEIDGEGHMIKGGGAALTREKIIAAKAKKFVCIADESKRVAVLGQFPLPIEVIPMARELVLGQLRALGAKAQVRADVLTDNGNLIIDAAGLHIENPIELERTLNQWPGVVTVGLFAQRKADVCLLGTSRGIETLNYKLMP